MAWAASWIFILNNVHSPPYILLISRHKVSVRQLLWRWNISLCIKWIYSHHPFARQLYRDLAHHHVSYFVHSFSFCGINCEILLFSPKSLLEVMKLVYLLNFFLAFLFAASTWEISNLSTPSSLSSPRCLVTQTLEINPKGWFKWRNKHCQKFEKTVPYALLSQVSGWYHLWAYFARRASHIETCIHRWI